MSKKRTATDEARFWSERLAEAVIGGAPAEVIETFKERANEAHVRSTRETEVILEQANQLPKEVSHV